MKEREINQLIRHIGHSIKAKGDASLRKRGLTFSQVQILFNLNQNGGQMSQKELEDKLNVAHPTVVGLVRRLEKNGYVTSVTDKNDKRKKIIVESAKARKFKDEKMAQIQHLHEKMFSRLSEKEKEELFRMLKMIDESLKEDEEGR